MRLNVPQAAITTGVPSYRDPEEITLPKILAMPFGPERPAWRLSDAERRERCRPRSPLHLPQA